MVRYDAEEIAVGERGVIIPHPRGRKRERPSSAAQGPPAKLRPGGPPTPLGHTGSRARASVPSTPAAATQAPADGGISDSELRDENLLLWELLTDDEEAILPPQQSPTSNGQGDRDDEMEGVVASQLADQSSVSSQEEEREVRALDLPARRKW